MSWITNYLWPRAALSDLQVDVGVVLGHQRRQSAQLDRMESLIMTSAQNLAARLDAATNEIARDLQAARDAALAAVADKDEAVRTAVEEALEPLDAGVARLEAMGADEANPVPDAPAAEPTPAVEDDSTPPPAA